MTTQTILTRTLRRPLALLGALAVLALAFGAHEAAAGTKQAVLPEDSRPACTTRPGHATCAVYVRTNARGIPLVFKHPRRTPTAAGTSTAVGLSPQNFHSAYALPWRSGVQQTIAVVDAYDHPNVKADLDYFDSAWGLGAFPTCSAYVTTSCFQRVDQNGNNSGFTNGNAAAAQGWNIETNLDVQTARGICLNCKLLLVEAYDDTPLDLAAAVNTAARLGATEISNSYGWLEGTFSTWNPTAYVHPGIAITASAHDHGFGAYYPADLNTVVAVGGTKLTVNSDGSYGGESVWGNGVSAPSGSGTGSGCSTFNVTNTAAPTWQTAQPNWQYTGCGTRRAIADVAADADPNTGAWVYTSAANEYGQTGWLIEGGTSLSAPILAGVYALAGNAGSTSWPGAIPYAHPGSLHDVTSGANGSCSYYLMCHAWAGYDGPTGMGTPYGLGAF